MSSMSAFPAILKAFHHILHCTHKASLYRDLPLVFERFVRLDGKDSSAV